MYNFSAFSYSIVKNEPFHDENWQLVRVKDTDKVFLWLYERNGYMKFSLLCVGLYDYFEKSPRMFRNNQQQS